MKKPRVEFSFPAKILDFRNYRDDGQEKSSPSADERFSRGKLAVFYKGETADHRYFSDAFSQELIKSLPYTPIVSYYDKGKKDFEGHADEQAIYGIVDPRGEIKFEKMDDGNVWAVCDTVYYTERPDEVGEIASQIKGHEQSLELADAKYIVNYDERRHFKNIEFTEGKIVGVSVLGKNQSPAFPGATFFARGDEETFEKKMALLKDFVAEKSGKSAIDDNSICSDKDDKAEMEIKNYSDFIKLTYGEVASKLDEAIVKEYGNEAYTCVEDMDDKYVYVAFCSYIDGAHSYQRIAYSVNEADGSVALGDVAPVRRVWEELPKEAPSAEPEEPLPPEAPEIASVPERAEQQAPTEMSTSAEVNEDSNPAVKEETFDETPSVAVSTEANATAEREAVAESGSGNPAPVAETQGNSGAASLTDSERAEFEALKRREKVDLLNSYKGQLEDEKFKELEAKIDTYESKDALELDLLRAFKDALPRHTGRGVNPSTFNRAPAYAPIVKNTRRYANDDSKGSSDDEWIAESLHRD